MTQNAVQQPTLPQTHVLSYVTAINTPTRMRRVAFGAVLAMGVLGTMISLGVLALIAWRCVETYRAWSGPFGMAAGPFGGPPIPPPVFAVLRAVLPDYLWLLAVAVPLLPSPLLVIIARPVLVGRPKPSMLARHFLLIPMFQLMVTAAIWNGWAAIMCLPLYGNWDFHYLKWLLTFPIVLVVILLLQDLRSYLRWIARNPVTEKPPTPFLPGRPA